jgi:hypothetical protein
MTSEEANKAVEEYLDKYCKKHKITAVEAMRHRLVEEVVKMYLEK